MSEFKEQYTRDVMDKRARDVKRLYLTFQNHSIGDIANMSSARRQILTIALQELADIALVLKEYYSEDEAQT